jgi:hypothetical protein
MVVFVARVSRMDSRQEEEVLLRQEEEVLLLNRTHSSRKIRFKASGNCLFLIDEEGDSLLYLLRLVLIKAVCTFFLPFEKFSPFSKGKRNFNTPYERNPCR